MQTPAKPSIFLLLLLLIKWVYANETVTLFLPLIPRAPLVASVAGRDSTATTYVLQCAPSPSVFCAIPQNFTLTEGPSTACYTVTQVAIGVTSSLNCKYSGTTTAECSGGTALGGVTKPTSTTLSSAFMEAFFQQVVLTASDTTCTSTSAQGAHATTATGATAASTTGLPVVSRSTTVSGSVAAVSTAGAAGVPRVTGGSQFVLGGAGMALAAILAVIAL